MKKTFLWFFALFSFSLPLILISCENNQIYNINNNNNIEILDGDTFKITNDFIIRLYGVDTPEFTHSWDNKKDSEGLELFYAIKAKKFSELFFSKNEGQVNIDIKSIDKFQRKVSKININGKDLAIQLLKNGLAIVQYISLDKKNIFFTKEANYFYELISSQNEAIKLKKGFWQNKNLDIKNIYKNPNVKLL